MVPKKSESALPLTYMTAVTKAGTDKPLKKATKKRL
ncbi:Uncharacterised protein [Lederbergia lenta]|uniref:Uncharacterized protein n=1 Tax=Lederbergia lenta TaxID=1467 RepID=A0A2X4VLY3_LEDLE|nr:Uncharacterised protein [Lederbergia lenta]